jgi:hypothetical protein
MSELARLLLVVAVGASAMLVVYLMCAHDAAPPGHGVTGRLWRWLRRRIGR